MPSDESKGSQLDAIGSLAQRQLDNTSTDVGTQLAELFVSNFGDGGKRTSLATIQIADPRAYEAFPFAKRLNDKS